jgi:hypothetical protein
MNSIDIDEFINKSTIKIKILPAIKLNNVNKLNKKSNKLINSNNKTIKLIITNKIQPITIDIFDEIYNSNYNTYSDENPINFPTT